MKIKHQLKGMNAEREVNDDFPLGFFMSNKLGGLLFFDTKKDMTQYYARLAGKTIKVIHDMNVEGDVKWVSNRFHSIEISRDIHRHELFLPYYMNAMLITAKTEGPIQLVLEPKDMQSTSSNDHNIAEKKGRLVVASKMHSPAGARQVYTVIQGQNLKYDHSLRKGDARFTVDLLSPKISIAFSDNEDEAIATADHMLQNEQKIRELQESYISSSATFKDPEASLAYACVLNATDHAFLAEEGRDTKSISPVPFFSEVTSPHTVIAAHSLIAEGEFGIVKKTLLNELEKQHKLLLQGKTCFQGAAWSSLLFGKLLNKLCANNKLYTYFTKEEIRTAAERIAAIARVLREKYCTRVSVQTDSGTKLESQSLMLSIYNLMYALTKSDEYAQAEEDLKAHSRKLLFDSILPRIASSSPFKREDANSIFLSAYIYPFLLSGEEWQDCIDKVLDSIHNNFTSLQSKMQSKTLPLPVREAVELEIFGLTNLAAIVLNRINPEHYEKQINNVLRTSISEVLYKGVIGRPSSAYDHDTDPENKALIENVHLLNNALFLEMLRDCAC
ncbi:hypothetical protein JW898_00800 [Candidatus Woesearchaeota archaeon]|nr:hypothetical protein [Candidatus Woesearchaeota archaeon]